MILLLATAWGSLTLDAVLERVDTRVPELATAEAWVDAASAERTMARGAFDPTLQARVGGYGGKYPRQMVDVGVKTSTVFGPSLSVGYGRGVGTFPDYAGKPETKPEGELYGKLELPLLDGLGYGDKRAKLASSGAKVRKAEATQAEVARKLRLEASKRYWKWVGAGRGVEVAEALLGLAEARREALKRRVEIGDRAEVDLLDNQRVVDSRRAALAAAQRKLEVAAQELSLLYRGDDGNPVVPQRGDLPAAWPALPELPAGPVNRPDRAKLEATAEVARIAERRAKNSLLPELTAEVGSEIPLGDDEMEWMAGVRVDAPLAFREGIGRRRAASATVASISQEQRALSDRINAELAATEAAVRRSREAVEAAATARDLADRVLTLKRRAFELGDTDLFELIQREDVLAKARKDYIDAETELRIALAEARAARGG